ncbi:hypothetical protein TNCV_2206421 [Trichonephila clavipes]|uniref:Uncharacterized protein n=1 Tax=Trichonephila clavipes TaxID=2585209 RepID=A0A8X6SB13_TRICX|nr:hypothetical protein TNCV_2206421 [Trichonephila clavipes]
MPWELNGYGHELVTGVSWVRLKTRRVKRADTRYIHRAQILPIGLVWLFGEVVPAQTSSSSLDHGSKFREPSPIALVLPYSATLTSL